jgi:uncharacterized protein with PIN domain
VDSTRFVTDSSLDFLARRLRILGYDVLTLPGARLEDLFAYALQEGRTVMTSSARHPRRFASVPAVAVPREEPAESLRSLVERHAPAGAPFSRCARCNTPLRARHPMEASGEVPGRVLRSARSLRSCPACGKWYWDGSHVARLLEWLEAALGRPVAVPHREPTPPPQASASGEPSASG